MWQRLNRREQVLLIVLGVMVVLYFYWAYLLQPQLQAIGEVRRELEMATARLEKGQDIAGSIRRWELALREAEKESAAVAPRFNNDFRDGMLLADIGLEAARQGLAVTLVRPAEVVSREGNYLELPLEFAVRGDYRRVLEFIKKIENLTNVSEIRKMEIKSLALAENPAASPLAADGRVVANFTPVIYAAPAPENQIKLDALADWAVGRYNAYEVEGMASPHPEIKMTLGRVSTEPQAEPGEEPGTEPGAQRPQQEAEPGEEPEIGPEGWPGEVWSPK